MSLEPIRAGGLGWYVEQISRTESRGLFNVSGLRASIVSMSVEVVFRSNDNRNIEVSFSKGGWTPGSEFPAAMWLSALEVAHELIERIAPMRGVAAPTSQPKSQ